LRSASPLESFLLPLLLHIPSSVWPDPDPLVYYLKLKSLKSD